MFSKPNYTQTPNEFYDDIAKTLKEGELRVLLAIMRQTFGWGKQWDRISLRQLEQKTGLCRESVINAVRSLVIKKLIIRHTIGENGMQKSWYTLHVENEIPEPQKDEDYEEIQEFPNGSTSSTPPSLLSRPHKRNYSKETKENQEKKAPRIPVATAITLNPSTKKFEGISEDDIKRWRETFPAVNIIKELTECLLWALTTPRKNYRKSIDTWMRNVSKSHTEPFKRETELSIPGTEQETSFNKRIAEDWEKTYENKKSSQCSVESGPSKVIFVLPEGSYSVEYGVTTKEFLRKCEKGIRKLQLHSPKMDWGS